MPPIFQSSLFVKGLDGGDLAKCFSSGMAAITAAVMSIIEKDCHIITIANVYGPTRTFFSSYLKKLGIEVTFVKGESVDEFEAVIRPNTKLIYLESPSSFVFRIQNLAGIAELANAKGITTVIDNTPGY